MKKFITALLILGCSLGFVACKKTNKKVELEVPTELVVENQFISFNEVENASYYNIYYNGNTWTVQPTYQGEVVVDASKIFTEIRTYEVKVKAIGTGKYLDSKYSNSYYYERTQNLGVPSVKLNQETLTWSPIDNATSYTIKVVFPDKTVGLYNYTDNSFDIRLVLNSVGEYSFQVKAGKGEDSVYSTQVTYNYSKTLSTPSNLSLEYNRDDEEVYLYFLADEASAGYTINVNDVNYELSDSLVSKYVIKTNYKNYKKVKLLSFLKFKDSSFEYVKDFNVSVKAKTSNLTYYANSAVSNKVSISIIDILSAPSATLSDVDAQTKLSWRKVDGAKSYTIYKNFEFYTNVDDNKTDIIFNKLDLQNQILSVQAIGVDGKYNSPLSLPKYLTGMADLTEDYASFSNGVLSFNADADRYFIEIYNNDLYKNIVVEEIDTVDLKEYVTFGEYTVKVACYKEGFNPQVLEFKFSHTKTLTKPAIVTVGNLNSMYTISLREVSDAIGYAIKINNKLVDKIFTTTKIDLTRYISTVGSYTIQVQAVADPTTNISSSSWESRTILHTQQLLTPKLKVEYNDDKYILKFDKVEGAYNYSILVNYIPIFEQGVFYNAEGFDITSYLTTAQEYTVMVKANPGVNDIHNTVSDYGTIAVRKYIQLDVINNDVMMINNTEGKYWLSFATQTHAASYDIRIYHIEEETETKFNTKTVPCDITSFIQDSGTYKVFITAVANTENEYLYLSSAESGNPLVYVKNKPTLDPIKSFSIAHKISGNPQILAEWNKIENADKYYLTISYTNNFESVPVVRQIAQVYTTSSVIDLAQYLTKEGQYTIKIKAMSDSVYEACAFTTFTHNYNMEIDEDFKRNIIMFNGIKYSHYVDNFEHLSALLHYYYLYDGIKYNGYNIKFMLAEGVTIDSLNAECALKNLGFTNDADAEISEGVKVTEAQRMKKLTETAIMNYSEGVYFGLDNPFGEPIHHTSKDGDYYTINYKTGLSNNKVSLEYTGKPLFKNTNNTIAVPLRRNDNYIYKLELKEKVDVSTTEQLFMVVQSGYAPNFVGNSVTAKTVYDNAKAVLNTICTDQMTDYEKVVAIYSWLISNVNYNYAFDELMYKTIGEFTDESNTVRIGDVSYNYLESIFLDENRISVSNGISKAFVLLCALEGIESVKVNGVKNGINYYWNKVKIDCSPDDEEIKSWYVVNVSGAYQTLSIQDGEDSNTINYNIGSYQYFLVTDTYLIQKMNIEEKYNMKNAVCNNDFNYYFATSYSYEKIVKDYSGDEVEIIKYSGSGTLKFTGLSNNESQSIETYIIDILSYMVANATEGNKYLVEIDIESSNAVHGDLINKIQGDWSSSVSSNFSIGFKTAAVSQNNKLLIAISQIVIKTT